MPRPTELPAWQQLHSHRQTLDAWRADAALAADPSRRERLTVEAGPLTADCAHHRISGDTLQLLAELADQAGVQTRFARMLRGDPVNLTEGRSALHTALRSDTPLVVGGTDLRASIAAGQQAEREFAAAVRSGDWRGASGASIRHVINLGIGGSDLGPALALDALAASADGPIARCVSDLDPRALAAALGDCEPASTLFIVCSKTFGTLETLANAQRARNWLLDGGIPPAQVQRHFAAVTANPQRAREWGVAGEQCFAFGDWVGGRYSLWSAVGLVLQIACGSAVVAALHRGAHAIDTHFADTPIERNLPALMGLLGIWYRNFWGAQAHAVLPYAWPLRRLPDYLQQLEMESLGKRTDLDGHPVTWDTGGVLFGAAGSHAQHAFLQLLHQGTALIPADIIVFDDTAALEPALNANAHAQARVLCTGGQVAAAPAPHGDLPGNQPSTVIRAERLDAESLGALLACYEHKVFTQACVWHINAFDQWGVELGKQVAQSILRGETG
ncbi:MAG: glucose-6-phosphate isomerase [Burkholderiales bacterium]